NGSSAVMALLVIPSEVSWSYFSFGVVLAIGLVTSVVRGEWQKARGFDKVVLFGPVFYAAPLACFGTEHFTLTKIIASLIPAWIPWHTFWAYFVGLCFIGAALSLVTRIQARLAASLLALTFFLFVVLMDAPAWVGIRKIGFSWRSRCGNYRLAVARWHWQPASATSGESAAGTSWRRLRDTSLPFRFCFTASSSSCTAITFPAFRWKW